MIANTRKMHDLQEKIKDVVRYDTVTSDITGDLISKDKFTVDDLGELRRMAKDDSLFTKNVKKLDREEIMKNPFLENISIPNIESGNFALTKKRIIKPRVLQRYGLRRFNVRTLEDEREYYYCDKALRFPAVTEKNSNTCWMSVEPREINTFAHFIDEATGNVILVGCGIGYTAYMLSQKEDVKSITIVELNEDILKLFEENILPQFPNKDKITTVNAEGISYLKTADLQQTDYVNVDVWYDTADMIYPYLRCLEVDFANPQTKFSYWIEDELQSDIQKAILVAFVKPEHVEGQKGLLPKDDKIMKLLNSMNYLANVIGDDVVRKTRIASLEDFVDLVDIKDFRKFMFEWYANNLEVVDEHEAKDGAKLKGTNLAPQKVGLPYEKKRR